MLPAQLGLQRWLRIRVTALSGDRNPENLLTVKKRVYEALIVRYMVGRYGRGNIGFMWIILEPILFCVGVMAVWSATKGAVSHGINIIAIAYTGYLPLTIWRHMTSTLKVLTASKHLTMFHSIELIDPLIAKLILDFISVTASALIVYFVLEAMGFLPAVYDWGDMLHGWVLMGALGFGAGLLTAVLSETSDVFENVYGPFQYFQLPFSGCFFMVDWLPTKAQEIIWWIPMVHCYELIRGGFLGPSSPTHSTPEYTWAWAIVLTGLGFQLFRAVEDRVGQ